MLTHMHKHAHAKHISFLCVMLYLAVAHENAQFVFESQDLPSADALQIANNLSNLGKIYNREDLSTDVVVRQNTKMIQISSY